MTLKKLAIDRHGLAESVRVRTAKTPRHTAWIIIFSHHAFPGFDIYYMLFWPVFSTYHTLSIMFHIHNNNNNNNIIAYSAQINIRI